jgi:hypothetical protein
MRNEHQSLDPIVILVQTPDASHHRILQSFYTYVLKQDPLHYLAVSLKCNSPLITIVDHVNYIHIKSANADKPGHTTKDSVNSRSHQQYRIYSRDFHLPYFKVLGEYLFI